MLGRNCPEAITPTEVIPAHSNTPWTERSASGWSIRFCGEVTKPYVNAVVKFRDAFGREEKLSFLRQVDRTKELITNNIMVKLYEKDFADQNSDAVAPSLNKRKFMRIYTRIIEFRSGHYHSDLPFTAPDPIMPDNRECAKSCLMKLKRGFIHDPSYHQVYTAYFNKIAEAGIIVQIPHSEINRNDGRVNYIPHHGVRHPKEGTLRVVINCAPRGIKYARTTCYCLDQTWKIVY